MTSYITAVGVQHFSITIASGSLTGTATITAVGSGAFILLGGINPSASANTGEQTAWLTKTSSTVITATRATLTAGTVTVFGCIVDGDTTNLIKSVQYGTVTITAASASGTATISAVTDANTALHYLGFTVAVSAIAERQELARLSLSGTTVTATVGLTAIANITVGFVVIEFQSSCLTANAVQRISAASSSSVTSYTATLTNAVVLNNSLCLYGGSSIGSETTDMSHSELNGQLTGVSTFTVGVNTASTSAKTYNASIIEFNSGVLNSAAQRNTTTLTGATSNTSTITSVVKGNSGISYLNQTSSVTTGVNDQAKGAAALTNATTVTVTKTTSTSNITGSWEVFEFPSPANNNTVTETVTETDSETIVAIDSDILTENQTETDSSVIKNAASLTIAESLTATDSYSSLIVLLNTLTETTTASDVVRGAATGLTNLNETGSVTDLHSGIAFDLGIINEAQTESDAYSGSQTQPGNNVTETTTESDIANIIANAAGNLSETVAANDNYQSALIPAGLTDQPSATGAGPEKPYYYESRRKYLEWLKKKQTRERIRNAKFVDPGKASELIAVSPPVPPLEIQKRINTATIDLQGISRRVAQQYLAAVYTEMIAAEIKAQEEDEEILFMMTI